MGSPERKGCSNMAPVRRLRSLAWMKARRLPGVRCSTVKTECSSLLCLMIMPGRICVAGIAMGNLLQSVCQKSVAAPDAQGEPQAACAPAGEPSYGEQAILHCGRGDVNSPRPVNVV